MSVVDRVRELVVPLLAKDGLELFDVEFGAGRLAVLVDRPGGIDLGALTRATHDINAMLDATDPVPGRYLLEVSSPGLERTLRTPAHFSRYVGSLVSVKTKPGAAGERRAKGTLTAADDDGFTVDERRFAYADVERCHTVFEWGPAARPGRKAVGKAKAAPLAKSTKSSKAVKSSRTEKAVTVGIPDGVTLPDGPSAPDSLASEDRHPTSDTKATAS